MGQNFRLKPKDYYNDILYIHSLEGWCYSDKSILKLKNSKKTEIKHF
jgi:hypothetical protein